MKEESILEQVAKGLSTSSVAAPPDGLEADELEEKLEWEEWNGQGSFAHHMLAGSCAGVAEHLCMFPVDTFKVRARE